MDAETALKRAGEGMQFLAVGSDLRMLAAKAQESVQTLYPGEEGRDVARY